MDTPSDTSQTGQRPVGVTGDQDPTPTCVPASAGAGLWSEALTTRESPTTRSRAEQTLATAHAHRGTPRTTSPGPAPVGHYQGRRRGESRTNQRRGGGWSRLRLVQRAMLDLT